MPYSTGVILAIERIPLNSEQTDGSIEGPAVSGTA
jgi:hypothetical protein